MRLRITHNGTARTVEARSFVAQVRGMSRDGRFPAGSLTIEPLDDRGAQGWQAHCSTPSALLALVAELEHELGLASSPGG